MPVRFICLIASVLLLMGCSYAPRKTTASIPYYRPAEADLSTSYKTIGVRVVGEEAAHLSGVERSALLPGLDTAAYDEADVRVEILSGTLASQVTETGSGPVYSSGTNISGYVHWKDVLFSQKGLIRVRDRTGKELFRSDVDIADKVQWGFSVRGPGQNIPQGGDRRFARYDSEKSFYTPGEMSASLQGAWPQIVSEIRASTKRSFEYSLKSFTRKFSGGDDSQVVYLYHDGDNGYLSPTEKALESRDPAALSKQEAALMAIVASGYLDPAKSDKPTILKPQAQAAVHVNLGLINALLGKTTEADANFNKAIELDKEAAKTVSSNQASLPALLNAPRGQK